MKVMNIQPECLNGRAIVMFAALGLLLASCGDNPTQTTPQPSTDVSGNDTVINLGDGVQVQPDATSADSAVAKDTSTAPTDVTTGKDTAIAPTDAGTTDTTVVVPDAGGDSAVVTPDATVEDGGGDAVSGSCVGKCGKYDADAACQCDDGCSGFGDCCEDYAQVCKEPDPDGTGADSADSADTVDGGGQVGCTSDAQCDDKNGCTTDACVTGLCNNTPNTEACDDGNKCTTDDVCAAGKCAGKAKACDDGDACTDDSCDPAKDCVHTPNTAACEDGDKCLDKKTCKDGKCEGGTKKDCDDKDKCTTDSCDSAAGCIHTPAEGPCDDGNACTSDDACKGGTCAGTAKDCADSDPCTDDVCDPKTLGCVHNPSPDNTPCTDGDVCTDSDVCSGGKCAGKDKSCDDGNPCTKDACDAKTGSCDHTSTGDGAACNDGNACTTGDKCAAGVCKGVGKDCDDGDACTVDTCDPKSANQTCTHAPATDGSKCADGDKCTVDSVCTGGKCAGKPKSCDDSNTCTKDTCSLTTGLCVHATDKDGAACDDGDACSNGDKCAAGKCVGVKVCDDNNPCTDDICDPKTGACSAKPAADGGTCDDGDKCSSQDACKGGKCVGVVNTCNDGEPCTADLCDASTGKCSNTKLADGALCSDGNVCTSGDKCTAGKCGGGAQICTFKTVWSDNIDCAKAKDWTADPAVAEPKLGWHLDGTPATVKPKTGTCTVNFNNGKDYAGEGVSQGAITSPAIKVPDGTAVRLTLQSYHDVENFTGTGGKPYDARFVEISSDGFKAQVQSIVLDNAKTAKSWLLETIDLDAWRGRTIQLRLRFDSVDTINNSGTGWFVDDLAIQVGTTPGSCVGRCGNNDAGATCQCDADCAKNGNCCADFKALCEGCAGDKACDDGNICTADACNPKTKACENKAIANGASCSDGSACTAKDVCTSGACKGVPVDCSDGNDCTWDFCDKLKGCTYLVASGGCDDGDPCTTKDTCKDGKCGGGPTKCDDANSCTKDVCDAKTGACKHEALTDATACDDGNACTVSDACSGGKCVAGKATCDDGNPCTTDLCDSKTGACTNTAAKDGTVCNDGNACTLATVCTKGVCGGKDVCTYTSLLQDTFECGKNNGWTALPANTEPAVGWHIDGTANPPGYKSEKCSLNFNGGKDFAVGTGASKGTVTSPVISLPAGHARLKLQSYHGVESGSDSNQYDHRRIQVSDDGFKTSLQSWRLDNTKSVKAWEAVTIQLPNWAGKKIQIRFDFDSADGYYNDGPGWFIDDLIVEGGKIDPGTSCAGRCGQFVAGAACQCDAKCGEFKNCCGDYAGICTGCKSDLACDDGNPCTTDKCDVAKGTCNSTPMKDGASCEDGNVCTVSDVCAKGVCSGSKKVCTDGNVCTFDSCDPIKGCVFPSNSATCDDGDLCTAESNCNNGKCIGAKLKCDDGKPCTTDSCDAKTGKCTFAARPDGSACTTGDACLLEAKCAKGECVGKVKDCNDGNACTVDACDAKTGQCSNAVAKDGSPCVDGNACTANDVCTKGQCAGKDACTYAKLINATFACNAESGWTFAPSNKEPAVGWHIDGTPSSVTPKSPSCSLNFNDGKDFDPTPSATVAGTATSPALTVGAYGHARMSFWSYHDTETGASYDKRRVLISDDGFKQRVQVIELSNSANPKKWIQHAFELDAWLGKKIQVRMDFDSVDAISNGGTGWFVDDVVVEYGNMKVPACKNDGQCEDNNLCTVDSCTKDGTCSNSTAKSDAECADGEACTWDYCDPKGGCKHVSANVSCDDGNACTDKDACVAGQCQGQLKTCDDKNTCTADSCDPKAGGCKFVSKPDGTLCSDGAVCTVEDACTAGKCGGKAKCDDGNACTTDACDATTGACTHKASTDGSKCDDGNTCTTGDSCKQGVCGGVDSCVLVKSWSDAFACGSIGWTFTPVVKAGEVGWAVDATPAPPGYKSAACSMNFNNGKDFNAKDATGKAIKIGGAVISTNVAVPKADGAIIGLWSYNGVENHQSYDHRYVEVSDDGFAKNIQTWRLDNAQGIGQWTEIKLPLDKWMGKTVKFRLRFDSGDAIKNDGPGWFVDDFTVYAKNL